MSIIPEDIYLLAKKLIGTDEVSNRSSVSRAYYSVFHDVKLRVHGLPNFSYSEHSGIIEYLSRPSSYKGEENILARKIAIFLNIAKENRCIADYDLSQNLDDTFVQHTFDSVDNVISLVNELVNLEK